MAHKQEEVGVADYTGLDRAEGTLSESTGHEPRFYRDENDNVWEEILGDPDEGRRRVAPDYCEYTVEEEELEPEEALLQFKENRQRMIDELTERAGRFPFHVVDDKVLSYLNIVRSLMGHVGKQCFREIEEDEVVPPAFRVQVIEIREDESDHRTVEEILRTIEYDPGIFVLPMAKGDNRTGTTVRGVFIPDNDEEVEEKTPNLALVEDMVNDFLELFDLDEYFNSVSGDEHPTKLVPFHDITPDEKAIVNEIYERKEANIQRVPREGDVNEWVWAYQWKSSGVAGWLRVGAADNTFTYLGTERPDDVVEEHAEMFNVFNIHTNMIGMLEDMGVDLEEDLGLDAETIKTGREAWRADHSRSRRPKRR